VDEQAATAAATKAEARSERRESFIGFLFGTKAWAKNARWLLKYRSTSAPPG
jgi:hypothetical protein